MANEFLGLGLMVAGAGIFALSGASIAPLACMALGAGLFIAGICFCFDEPSSPLFGIVAALSCCLLCCPLSSAHSNVHHHHL